MSVKNKTKKELEKELLGKTMEISLMESVFEQIGVIVRRSPGLFGVHEKEAQPTKKVSAKLIRTRGRY